MKIEVRVRSKYLESNEIIDFKDLDIPKEEWDKLTDGAKQGFLNEYIWTYQPDIGNSWEVVDFKPKN